ncbi:NAD binding domain of 6-phosphogluconate dehydrogenase-domain-containing protein [Leptodontidium sp. MPI-SDFR-AT-0119]|nr:NAD binding domain of 6-phosphogluconate dehydrogenase-domain-containing protein [Leptodontidium sp. MPI-SDFR-AT-0119]
MASQKQPALGWIGLGSMGLNMAKNLQKNLTATGGPALNFTNRTLSRGVALVELGGVPCATIAEVISKSDIVFSSISDDSVLDSIVSEMLACGSLTGKIIVDTSTVHPDSSVRASKKLTEAGAVFAAAPVFGASPVAEAGQLLFVVAGPTAATEAIAPYLKGVMGREVISLGEDVSKASLMKTSGNFITATMMEMISEAHVFAEKTGLGSEAMETLIKENYGPLAYTMSRRLTTGVYVPAKNEKPWSDLNLAIKDVGHGITAAENAGTRLKIGEVVLGHLKEAKEYSESHGGRSLDSSSMYGVIRKEAGLDFETDLVKERDA